MSFFLNRSFLNAYSAQIESSETDTVSNLLKNIDLSTQIATAIEEEAGQFILAARKAPQPFFNKLLIKYGLSTSNGITLLCLAESLLRIPDGTTAGALIAEKTHLQPLLARLGWPIIREGVAQMGKQFVIGEDIQSALNQASAALQYRYSFDMLGEAAKTHQDAQNYFEAYVNALHAVGSRAIEGTPITRAGISVKLSALHPRYQYSQVDRLLKELVPKLIELAALAKKYQISLTVDAEETERLQLSLIMIEAALASQELADWDGFGLAVQAYQKAAPAVLDFCADLAKRSQHRLLLRLVKGAYWDSEIKNAQVQGFAQYPVYTRKMTTDVSYLVCAQKILKNPDAFYPQFATHNAYTIAAVLQMLGPTREFEFQRLYGMGESLYAAVMAEKNIACRVYAPVGDYSHLLAYLVRRLLENGANTSFVQQLENKEIPIEKLTRNPIEQLNALQKKSHPDIPLPQDLYTSRKNSEGLDFSNFAIQQKVLPSLFAARGNPGLHFKQASKSDCIVSLNTVDKSFAEWSARDVEQRAACLHKAADLLTQHQIEFMAVLIQEGHKTILDAQSEVREAIDYCRYYAVAAIKLMQPQTLPGPTGENNTLLVQGRGVSVCISPWNFPLAIFLGQILAALVTGNTVIAKPASNTPLIAIKTIDLLYEAGIPKNVLQLIIGKSSEVGDILIEDPRVALVVFTGSTQTAWHINQTLAARKTPIAAFIAETGGQNVMIVDSSALLEQVTTDVITSAFNSAGQRCSALRILCVQDEIYDKCLQMLKGAMAELIVGDPALLNTDVGPVIDQKAQQQLLKHIEQMKAAMLYQSPLPENLNQDYFFVAPTLIEIKSINELTQEVFGPVLHLLRYTHQQLLQVLHDLNATNYGLTMGIQSRIESFAQNIVQQTFVGNNYINRNMIGAVVGTQPFGGQHLSGTGPKAGGPHYLTRFITEKTLTTNTTALGGNISLLGLDDAKD